MMHFKLSVAAVALLMTASASWAHPLAMTDSPAQTDLQTDVSMSSTPTYPGPSPDTWINSRFPPPHPPRLDFSAPRDDLGRSDRRYDDVFEVGGQEPADEWEDCMNNPDNASMDYIELLGACFCLTTNNGSPGC